MLVMTTMHRYRNWKITVYGNEHGLPHFHIEGPGYRCSVSIEHLSVIVGYAPADVLKIAIAWAKKHREQLFTEWYRLNG